MAEFKSKLHDSIKNSSHQNEVTLAIDFKDLSGLDNPNGLTNINRHDNLTGINDLKVIQLLGD